MFDQLTALGWGVVTFAITIGVGTVVLTRFGNAVASCGSGYTFNATANTCYNASGLPANTSTPTGGWTTTNYLNTQLGTTGLAGWAPAIIAFAVGMLFLGTFIIGKGRSRSY